MRQTLSVLALAIIMFSCNSGKEKTDTKASDSKDTAATMSSDPDKTTTTIDTAGADSMDRIGDLSLGLVHTIVIEKLGHPDEKSKEVEWGADGLMHQDWKYKSKGIELNMSRDDKSQQIFSITILSPSSLKTSKSIGIGSSYDEVKAAYEKDIDKESSDANSIVVGSLYGGIIFNFQNQKVQGIFVGAAAE